MSKTDEDVEDLPLDSPKAPTTTEDSTQATTRTDGYGEEEEEEEMEEEVEEEEPSVYFTEDFISGPTWPEDSTVPADILVFEYPSLVVLIENCW